MIETVMLESSLQTSNEVDTRVLIEKLFTNFPISDTLPNFEKARSGETNAYGVQYDTGSVMHYSSTAFSINGQKTIEALVSFIQIIY